MSPETLKLLNSTFFTLRLLEENGRIDGLRGVARDDGWDELVAVMEAKTGEVWCYEHAHRTFYENGWQKGVEEQQERVKAAMVEQGWSDVDNAAFRYPISDRQEQERIEKEREAERQAAEKRLMELKALGYIGNRNTLDDV